jgi:hypothetical protein
MEKETTRQKQRLIPYLYMEDFATQQRPHPH